MLTGALLNAAWDNARSVGQKDTDRDAAWNAARETAWNIIQNVQHAGQDAWNNTARDIAWNNADRVKQARDPRMTVRDAAIASTRFVGVATLRKEDADKHTEVWLPFVEAHEAGLWLFWVRKEEIIAVPRPVIKDTKNCLRRNDGLVVYCGKESPRRDQG